MLCLRGFACRWRGTRRRCCRLRRRGHRPRLLCEQRQRKHQARRRQENRQNGPYSRHVGAFATLKRHFFQPPNIFCQYEFFLPGKGCPRPRLPLWHPPWHGHILWIRKPHAGPWSEGSGAGGYRGVNCDCGCVGTQAHGQERPCHHRQNVPAPRGAGRDVLLETANFLANYFRAAVVPASA